MSTVTLPNDHWSKIVEFLHSCPDVYVGQEAKCRRFIEGVLWIARSGAQWRLLPEKYGNWNSVYKRFARWCDKGIWDRMHQHFADDPDMEYLILDSTVVRAHPCAAGALKKNGGQAAQALGRSRGGFSTKIHISVDALGNPLRFRLTAGQRHDITQAEPLIAEYVERSSVSTTRSCIGSAIWLNVSSIRSSSTGASSPDLKSWLAVILVS
jgi:transposase